MYNPPSAYEDSLKPVFVQAQSPVPSSYNVQTDHDATMEPIVSDEMSLVQRPAENRFTNVHDLQPDTSASHPSKELVIEDKDLTPENIEKLLCKNPNCPAVKKFKNFGIGPLATGKALGTLYEPTDTSLNYGLSHTYGSLENYGPYGVYKRPKTLEQPFVARHNNSEESLASSYCSCDNNDEQKKANGQEPLRLTGGGPTGDEIEEFPGPMAACKDLMQDFDELLKAYKQAMGPCGQTTCPYSGNLIEDACRRKCKNHEKSEEESQQEKGDDKMSACGIPTCPHAREAYMPEEKRFMGNQIKAACKSPVCPYTKQKLGFDDDDIDLVVKSCGQPKCKDNDLPPLQPIHWDCPDPLPKGLCKNRDCPLLSKELKAFKIPKGPCGSDNCPYAPPPWCGEPSCPFGPPQPCPYQPPQEPDECDDNTCPYKNGQGKQQQQDPKNVLCENTDCPFMEKKPSPSNCPANGNGNGNGCCPYGQQQKPPPFHIPPGDVCSLPGCPYSATIPPDAGTVCSNTDCPYNTPKSNAPAPDFIYAPQMEVELCKNPDCPYQRAFQQQAQQLCPPVMVCGLPACPYDMLQGNKAPGGGAKQEDELSPCTSATCMGNDCDECTAGHGQQRKSSGGGSQSAPEIRNEPAGADAVAAPQEVRRDSDDEISSGKKRKKRKRRSKFVYAVGDKYPGVHIGHRECVAPGKMIPPKMGWLWNVFTPCMSLRV